MSFWQPFWEIVLVASLGGFACLVVVVAIGGFSDIRSMLRQVEMKHGENAGSGKGQKRNHDV